MPLSAKSKKNNCPVNGSVDVKRQLGLLVRLKKAHQESVEAMKLMKVDGLPNIIRSGNGAFALLWSVLLLASASTCVYLISNTISNFKEYQVSTTFRVLNEQKSVFPTITFCNLNPFATSFAIDLLKQMNLLSVLNGDPFDNYMLYLTIENYLFSTRGSYLSDAEKQAFTDLNSMLVGCSFQGVACSPSDFVYIFHPVYLNCYRYNANATKVVNLAGKMNSLLLQLYVDLPSATNLNILKGVHLFIQNSSDYPYNAQDAPMMITLGLGNNIRVDRSFSQQHPTPFSGCSVLENNELAAGVSLDDRSLFDRCASTDYAYSQRTCFAFCQQELVATRCNCTQPGVQYKIGNLPDCLTAQQANCSNVYWNYFLTSDYATKKCLPRCPLECNQHSFQTFNTQYKYPNYSFKRNGYQINDAFTYKSPYLSGGNYTDWIGGKHRRGLCLLRNLDVYEYGRGA